MRLLARLKLLAAEVRMAHPAKRKYLEELWAAHDWLEREVIRVERTYSDRTLDRLLER